MYASHRGPSRAASDPRDRFAGNGLAIACNFDQAGKLCRKTETFAGKTDVYTYTFDTGGRLVSVSHNGRELERYAYNRQGQRISQERADAGAQPCGPGAGAEQLSYDSRGRLVKAGDASFEYDPAGALARRMDCRGVTHYAYGRDTLLDRVVLTSGAQIRYEYAACGQDGPVRRYKDGELNAEYQWSGQRRLTACRDHEHGVAYWFGYNASGALERMRLSALPGGEKNGTPAGRDWLASLVTRERGERLRELLGPGGSLDARVTCDQVGTPRLVTDGHGRVLKELRFDSFGVLLEDSNPDLVLPVGFAGGLCDRDTGLTHFGWRDYDPAVGRFTAPDPARDRRGDADPYDYCVDDPVSRFDPTGLWYEEIGDEDEEDFHDYTDDDDGAWASSPGASPDAFPDAGGDAGGERSWADAPAVDGAADRFAGRQYAQAPAQTATDAAGPPQGLENPRPAAGGGQPAAGPVQERGAPANAQPQENPQAAQAQGQQQNQPQAQAGQRQEARGLRNNNPGNVRILHNDTWQGQTGAEGEFAIFDTMDNGLRAMAVNALTHHLRGRADTMSELAEIWAPRSDGNNPHEYLRNARAGSGYDPNAQLDFNDPIVLRNIINGITTAENSRIFPREQVDAAIAVAREHHRRRAEERRIREEERRLREQERRRQ